MSEAIEGVVEIRNENNFSSFLNLAEISEQEKFSLLTGKKKPFVVALFVTL